MFVLANFLKQFGRYFSFLLILIYSSVASSVETSLWEDFSNRPVEALL